MATCIVCGRSFPAHGPKKTCSPECAALMTRAYLYAWKHAYTPEQREAIMRDRLRDARPGPISCPVCGKVIEHPHGSAIYCSKHCRERATRARKPHKALAIIRDGQRVCSECGKVIEQPLGPQKYCSPECKEAAFKRAAKERYEEKKRRTRP